MEKFATQLHIREAFEQSLKHFNVVLRTQQTERDLVQGTLVQRMPTFAKVASEGIPFSTSQGKKIYMYCKRLLKHRLQVVNRIIYLFLQTLVALRTTNGRNRNGTAKHLPTCRFTGYCN